MSKHIEGREGLVAKCRKLAALAHNQSNTPEGDAAAAAADRLMREHAISLSELSQEQQDQEDPLAVGAFDLRTDEQWAQVRFHILARFLHCRAWIHGADPCKMGMVGHASSLEILEYLYITANVQLEGELDNWLDVEKARVGKRPKKAAQRDWQHTANAALNVRLDMIKADGRVADPTGTALVLVRDEAVQKWWNAQRWGKPAKAADYNWNQAGADAAKRVRLNAGIRTDKTQEAKQLR